MLELGSDSERSLTTFNFYLSFGCTVGEGDEGSLIMSSSSSDESESCHFDVFFAFFLRIGCLPLALFFGFLLSC